MSEISVFHALRSFGVVEDECFLPVTVTYPGVTTGAVVPVFKGEKVDICEYVKKILPADYLQNNPVQTIHAYVNGQMIRIADDSGFVWACRMYTKFNNREHLSLPLYINGCPADENISCFLSSRASGSDTNSK